MENPNRNFKSQTCEDFIEVLASKAAVPGGGGASALAGAIGIALGNMVGSLTVGKKTYADVEEEIIECKKQADEIAKEFLELMDKDAEAFEPLSKAYGLPKSTPEELAKKEEIMEEALNTAFTSFPNSNFAIFPAAFLLFCIFSGHFRSIRLYLTGFYRIRLFTSANIRSAFASYSSRRKSAR